jgi:hypothetical protein
MVVRETKSSRELTMDPDPLNTLGVNDGRAE